MQRRVVTLSCVLHDAVCGVAMHASLALLEYNDGESHAMKAWADERAVYGCTAGIRPFVSERRHRTIIGVHTIQMSTYLLSSIYTHGVALWSHQENIGVGMVYKMDWKWARGTKLFHTPLTVTDTCIT